MYYMQDGPNQVANVANFEARMAAYMRKKEIDTMAEQQVSYCRMYCNLQLEEQKNRNKMEILKLEEEIRIQREKRQEEAKIQREFASETLFEDDLGYLRILIKYPDGREKITQNVVNARRIRCEVLWSVGTERKIVKLYGENFEIFLDYDCGTKRIFKELRRHGVDILVSKERKRNLEEQLMAHVFKDMRTFEIPRFYGWNLMSDNTVRYAGKDDIAMEGLL